MKKDLNSIYINNIKFLILGILVIVSLIIFLFSKTFSNVVTNEEYEKYLLWDGTVATSFNSGDGTEENPYTISTGAELMYFASIADEEKYNTAYYKLNENINMDKNDFTSIKEFSGHFDGNGYSIAFMNIIGKDNIGFFASIKNADIRNLNLKEITIENKEANIGILVGNSVNSNIQNVAIYDSIIKTEKGNIGGLIGTSINSKINGCYINTSINYENARYIVGNNDSVSNITNSVIFSNEEHLFDENNVTYLYDDDLNVYKIEKEKEIQELNLSDLASMLTSAINEEFTWHVDREYLRCDLLSNIKTVTKNAPILKALAAPPRSSSIPLHDSGIEGDTVYVNDLEASMNYYLGLNYTENDSFPNLSNQNIYNESNLVKVYMKYSGTDINGYETGYVSLTERQSTYIYYKYYKVENGYVEIELIDNPFTDRPTNKGFNGWVTNYKDARISYDKNYYTRSVKIPVTYTNSIPNLIEINMYASWVNATIYEITSTSNNWNNAFNALKSEGMQLLFTREPVYESVANYYITGTVNKNKNYPAGAVNINGVTLSGRCGSSSCTYYTLNHSNTYESNYTYYELNGTMRQHNVQIIGYQPSDGYIDGIIAGFYKKKTFNRNESINGYYDDQGNILSGNCTSNTCTYYELINYSDNGQINYTDEMQEYYYLVTRDTNIIVMEQNQSSTWSSSNNKPFTLTSIYNHTSYTNRYWTINNIVVNCYNDTTIENIQIRSNQRPATGESLPTTTTSTGRYIFGRWNNLKLGRGIIQNSTYANFNFVLGGYSNSTGSSSNPTKYKLIIESGVYNSTSLTAGAVGTSYTNYVEAKAIYGSDYDRVNNDNNKLKVAFCTSGSYGGIYNSSNNIKLMFDTNVKSGSFGTNKYDYTTGIYVGGRQGGTHNAPKRIIVEGGSTYNLIGGPLTNSNRSTANDSYIDVLGGSIDVIIGGAGTSATYGNRIIQVTGGTVNYSVFGGSNGYQGTSSDGTVNGNSLVYIGGNSTIGSENNVNNNSTLWGAEAGSVFGIGNGRSGSSYTKVGSNDNSNIIIDGNATIRRNVYGGGNYGATGISSTSSTTTTNIKVIGGDIKGDIYGGGNKNGSGSTSKSSTININILNGLIEGNIYGGSNELGTIYGNSYVKVDGGTINGSVYGGGKGGYSNSTNSGTYVSQNVEVIVGNRSYEGSPLIKGNVYGGSAFGVVNSTSRSNSRSNYTTVVTINKGTIENSVFGGGQGNNTYTPYVCGDVTVNINDGDITNVFGANDAAGTPNGNILVNLNGGTIDNAYGGGKKAPITTSSINLKGSTVTNLYGGGNEAGATTTNVLLQSGIATNVYGGSNQSGVVNTSNINTPSNDVSSKLNMDVGVTKRNRYDYESTDYLSYEDLNVTITNDSDVDIVRWEASITTSNSVLNYNYSSTDINSSNSTYSFNQINRYYGTNPVNAHGSYNFTFGISSTVNAENFEIISTEIIGYDSNNNAFETVISDATVDNIIGGNNAGGTTGNTNINVNDLNVENIYGGGNLAAVTGNTIINAKNMTGTNIYGGGNYATVNGNTIVNVLNSNFSGSIFGGGNAGSVNGTTSLVVDNSTVDSVYGGGNSAGVLGNTDVLVSGASIINDSVFGGGNSGTIGSETHHSNTMVNIIGGEIERNVYGGCNTSIVYGISNVNIGSSSYTYGYDRDKITVNGTVFGGGEANSSGSEIYDFTFISVTDGININIDGEDYGTNLVLNGSVFGSGNASSSSGDSIIYINNLGSISKPNRAISIQRADLVSISNSVIELVGTTDRTNEYSTMKYSLNRIKLLKIKNDTSLLLQQNANLLEELQSLVDIDGRETKATVDISNGEVTRNTNNRIYLLANKILNVTTNEAATSYGKVSGMTFLGMYLSYNNGSYTYGIYNMENNDSADASDVIIGGSYILGLHSLNANYEEDGFYSNYIDDAYTTVTSDYIVPTPPNANYYMWSIGLDAINYSFSLTASKYSSLGTYELPLIDFADGNTKFNIVGVNTEGLTEGVNLVESNLVPKLASTPEEANSILGLSMKTETSEWVSNSTTKIVSNNNGSYVGDSSFKTDNQAVAPSLTFYLYHAKNITLDDDLGTINVTLQAMVPTNEIEYEVSLINIEINLTAKTFTDDPAYDASITYGKKYEMPAITDVNITNDSSFTSYYSLFIDDVDFDKVYGVNNNFYHVLTSNNVLPVGTKVTMIDTSTDIPNYYYFIVDQNNYNSKLTELNNFGEVTYRLSDFIKADSISSTNNYKDNINNQRYYDNTSRTVIEEFLFIFDFENTNMSGIKLDNSIILELRNNEDRTSVTVLGIRQNIMKYNLYDKTNIVLNSNLNYDDQYIYYNDEKLFNYGINVGYDQTGNRESIIDTNYETNSMGINITLFDASDNIVSSSLLIGTSIKIDDTNYYPSSDGVFRIKLSNKVSNLNKRIILIPGSNLPSGNYNMKIELFSSQDGLHKIKSDSTNLINLTLVGSDNAIESVLDKKTRVINGLTGVNLNNNNTLNLKVNYTSTLTNPNIRVSLYLKDKDSYNTNNYTEVDLKTIISNSLAYPASFGYTRGSDKEYMITNNPTSIINVNYNLRESLLSGTYKLVIRLYDNNQLIEEDNEYLIIKKTPLS